MALLSVQIPHIQKQTRPSKPVCSLNTTLQLMASPSHGYVIDPASHSLQSGIFPYEISYIWTTKFQSTLSAIVIQKTLELGRIQ